jgi:hypothetical protein
LADFGFHGKSVLPEPLLAANLCLRADFMSFADFCLFLVLFVVPSLLTSLFGQTSLG